jgi:hypothetical protein
MAADIAAIVFLMLFLLSGLALAWNWRSAVGQCVSEGHKRAEEREQRWYPLP